MMNEDSTTDVIIVDGVLHATGGYRGYDLWAWDTWVACDKEMPFDDILEWTDEQIDQYENRCDECYGFQNRKRAEKRAKESLVPKESLQCH